MHETVMVQLEARNSRLWSVQCACSFVRAAWAAANAASARAARASWACSSSCTTSRVLYSLLQHASRMQLSGQGI